MSKKEPKPPSIFTMAKNFSKELAKYIKEGAPNVSNKVYLERLETCNKCPHLIKKSMRCGLCGCLLEHKAKWKTTTCPDKPERWKPVFMDKATIELQKNYEEAQSEEGRKRRVAERNALAKEQAKINEALGRGNLTMKELTNPKAMKDAYAQIKYETKNKKNNNTKDSK